MEIHLDKRALKQIRLSATDSVEEGETDTLREDITQAFTDEQIEEIERRIENADFYDFLAEILDEWSGEDVDELMELLEAQLSDAGIDLKYHGVNVDGENDDDSAAVDDDDDDDEDEEYELSETDDEEEDRL